jgi:hypothetical protein
MPVKRAACDVSLLCYKFVAVRRGNFLSSFNFLAQAAQHSFLSKAPVGEHRALSFLYGMAMTTTLTLLCSPLANISTQIFFIIRIFSNMWSYMNLTVLALVAFMVSSALSAPTR